MSSARLSETPVVLEEILSEEETDEDVDAGVDVGDADDGLSSNSAAAIKSSVDNDCSRVTFGPICCLPPLVLKTEEDEDEDEDGNGDGDGREEEEDSDEDDFKPKDLDFVSGD